MVWCVVHGLLRVICGRALGSSGGVLTLTVPAGARAEIAKQIYQGAAGPALRLLLHSGEVNIIQSVCQLFQKLLAAGGEQLLNWEPNNASMRTLMQVRDRTPPLLRVSVVTRLSSAELRRVAHARTHACQPPAPESHATVQ